MSNVNFHQYFSSELKEFHAILIFQQEYYSKKLKENSIHNEYDETETLVMLKESIDHASSFFRGFSDLLAEGKMEKIKMNIEAILAFINASQNTHLKDYTKLFDEALERMDELAMIVEPTIRNEEGEILFQKNSVKPYEIEINDAFRFLNEHRLMIIGIGFTALLGANWVLLASIGQGFLASVIALSINILCLLGFIIGFKFLSNKMLKQKLKSNNDETYSVNLNKLIECSESTPMAKVVFENSNSNIRIGEWKNKNVDPRKDQFSGINLKPDRDIKKNTNTNQFRSTTNSSNSSGYGSSSSYGGYNSYGSSNDSSGSSCDGGSSGGGCD